MPSEKRRVFALGTWGGGVSQDKVTSEITMYHATYLFQTPSGITQETVNRKGQARICRLIKFHVWKPMSLGKIVPFRNLFLYRHPNES